MRHVCGLILLLTLLCAAPTVRAQAVYGPANDQPATAISIADRAAAALAREQALLEDPTKRCKREAENSREIVVCADPDKNNRDRLPLRNETDTARATDNGIPRAPDVFGIKDLGGVTIKGCLSLVQKCPPPIYYIDLSKIPEAPPGSDADKIARGEIPAP